MLRYNNDAILKWKNSVKMVMIIFYPRDMWISITLQNNKNRKWVKQACDNNTGNRDTKYKYTHNY